METVMPGITRVGLIEPKHLPNALTLRSLSDLPVHITGEIEEIELMELAKCTIKQELSGNGILETATLEFRGQGEPPRKRRMCAVFKTAQGQWYLLGTHEQCAKLTCGWSSGDFASSSGAQYEVTYSSEKALQRVKVYL